MKKKEFAHSAIRLAIILILFVTSTTIALKGCGGMEGISNTSTISWKKHVKNTVSPWKRVSSLKPFKNCDVRGVL